MSTRPKELNLDLPALRDEALAQLLTGLRLAVQRFDDLDAVERVLNAHANNGHAPALREVRRMAKLAASNGDGDHSPRKKYKRLVHNHNLPAEIVLALTGALAPMQSNQIVKALAARGLKTFSQASYNRAITKLVRQGQVERLRIDRRYPSYRLNAAAAEFKAQPVASKEKTNKSRISDEIAHVLAAAPKGMTTGELAEAIAARGFTVSGKSKLNQLIHATIPHMRKMGRLKSSGPTGKLVYTLRRPKFAVTKEATA